jgi:hypothetical protein
VANSRRKSRSARTTLRSPRNVDRPLAATRPA